MKEIMTVDEVAKYLGLHPHTVYRLCSEGKLPHTRIGRKFMFTQSAINQRLEGES
jgi:excisionase family DNA binding protein